MKIPKVLIPEVTSGIVWTATLTLLFLLLYGTSSEILDICVALPFFMLSYFLFFSIGRDAISDYLKTWVRGDLKRVLIVPGFLLTLYFCYILLNGENPIRGSLALLPYLILFPALVFVVHRNKDRAIGWLDFLAFVIYLLPTTFIEVNPSGELPFHGEGFDSMYRIILILSALYAFGVVRGIKDIGFFPMLNWRSLMTAIGVWMAFYLFVLIIGFNINFIRYAGHEVIDQVLVKKILITLVATFFHTAIFEELFFRGLLQNMLAKRISQANTWKVFWQWGVAISIPLALVVGYTLKGGLQWFPALMVVLLFVAAFFLERSKAHPSGLYTGLAITSTIFGLVHYHSHAIIYIGFACIAGWAYGYTYLKTKNVFYSALVYTLVNSSVVIFGLEFIK